MKLNSEAFKKLQKEWAQKLKDSGFEDIENSRGVLKYFCNEKFKANRQHGLRVASIIKRNEATEEYFNEATNILRTYNFQSNLEKTIWELHCEGWGRLKILKYLRDQETEIYAKKIELITNKFKKMILKKMRYKNENPS